MCGLSVRCQYKKRQNDSMLSHKQCPEQKNEMELTCERSWHVKNTSIRKSCFRVAQVLIRQLVELRSLQGIRLLA